MPTRSRHPRRVSSLPRTTQSVTINNASMSGVNFTATSNLAVTYAGPATGVVGTPYTGTFVATGGTPPYSFNISSGSLPLGLSLNGATGVVSGTPTTIGSSSFVGQVTDAASNTATTPTTTVTIS